MLNQHIVETPENISFGYPIAGVGSRFLAVFVDTLIQWTLFLLILVLALLASSVANLADNGFVRALPNYLTAFLLIMLFLIQFGYFILVEIITGGQSPGKSLFGLRVVKENGYPLTPLDSVIRNLIRIVDFLPLGYAVGVITMLLNDHAKRLGDFAVGTLVVKVNAPAKFDQSSASFLGAAGLPGVGRLKEQEIELAESFLQRRRQLSNAEALGSAIAQHLLARVNTPEVSIYAALHTPDELLTQIASAYRHRGDSAEAPPRQP